MAERGGVGADDGASVQSAARSRQRVAGWRGGRGQVGVHVRGTAGSVASAPPQLTDGGRKWEERQGGLVAWRTESSFGLIGFSR